MLALRVYVATTAQQEVGPLLAAHAGVSHVIRVGPSPDGGVTLMTADVDSRVVDTLLPDLLAHGVPGDDIEIVHRETSHPMAPGRPRDTPAWSGGGFAWSELTMTSRQYTHLVPQYLVTMVCAGVIAVFGILTSNSILVVGAMAISPDLLPMCAACVGLAARRGRLFWRALAVLVLGLTATCLTAFVVTSLLRRAGYGPASTSLAGSVLGVLPEVNVATVTVAAVAGVAGVLAFETRSSSAVGVAISVTTIPAAAYIGAAVALDDRSGARGALGVLAANVVMVIVCGTLTVLAQRVTGRGRRG